jgi:hypothetical protein
MQWLKDKPPLNYSIKVKHSGGAGEKPGRLEADQLKENPLLKFIKTPLPF